jgi:hypothetical protein
MEIEDLSSRLEKLEKIITLMAESLIQKNSDTTQLKEEKPKKRRTSNKQKLIKEPPDEKQPSTNSYIASSKKTETSIIKTSTRNLRTNTFNPSEIKIDPEEDKDTPKINLTPRNRPKFKYIKRVCEKCGKEHDINPAFNREYFVCDRCISKSIPGK